MGLVGAWSGLNISPPYAMFVVQGEVEQTVLGADYLGSVIALLMLKGHSC